MLVPQYIFNNNTFINKLICVGIYQYTSAVISRSILTNRILFLVTGKGVTESIQALPFLDKIKLEALPILNRVLKKKNSSMLGRI